MDGSYNKPEGLYEEDVLVKKLNLTHYMQKILVEPKIDTSDDE